MPTFHFIVDHPVLSAVLAVAIVAALVPTVLWLGTRSSQHRPRHRSRRRAVPVPGHEPRHAAPESHGRHASVPPGPGAFLGRTPDGDLALVDDDHTHELIGAST